MTTAAAHSATPLRVAILTSVHRWNDPRIFLKEAHALAAAGHQVMLIAERSRDEAIDNIRVCAIPFARNRIERMLISPLRIAGRALRADVCHFHDPELAPLGLFLKLAGKKVVYDVHEDLPRAIEYKHWIPAPLRWLASRVAELIEAGGAICFDLVVAATPIIAARFPRRKTIVVQNFPILEEMAIETPSPHRSRPPHFVYVGSVAAERGALQMVGAMACAQIGPDARLVIAGPCSPDTLLAEMQAAPGWDRVDYLGYQGRAEIRKLLAGARAGIVVLQPTRNLFDAFPTKLFEYMSAGLPVIASDYPVIREIVAGDNLGILVDPQNPSAIANAMRWMLDHPQEAEAMGERGRRAVIERYNWRVEADKLVAGYSALR